MFDIGDTTKSAPSLLFTCTQSAKIPAPRKTLTPDTSRDTRTLIVSFLPAIAPLWYILQLMQKSGGATRALLAWESRERVP